MPKTDSPSCMEAQRVMSRRTLALVPIADEQGSVESLFSAQLQPRCMSHCCCVSAGVSALSLFYISLTWCHAESSTHCCFFLCSHSVRPQGVQTCVTFREYLMLRSLFGTPLSPVERDVHLQHIFLCNVISCHYTRGFESEKSAEM